MKAPTTKILNQVTKSTQGSDYVGKVGLKEVGKQRGKRYQQPRMQNPQNLVVMLRRKLEHTSALHCNHSKSGFLLWDVGKTTSRLMDKLWLGSICLKTEEHQRFGFFQTSASVSWVISEVIPAAGRLWYHKLTRSKLHQTFVSQCKDVLCPNYSHILSKLYLSLIQKKKYFNFPATWKSMESGQLARKA